MGGGLRTVCACASALLLSAGSAAAVSGTHAPAWGSDLFGTNIVTLAIQIPPATLESLRNNSDSHGYVPCTVVSGSDSLTNVGIHCRGNPAKELATGKPDLIVTFDKFAKKQRFHGQRRLVLQAGRDDPSYVAVPIVCEMFRQADVPAPRCGYARVRFNGRDLGLYVLIEGVEKEFIQQHFGRVDGNLYDEGDPPDVTGRLEKASGGDKSDQSDADTLAAVALLADPAERWKGLQQRLDVDRFLTFTALEVLWWLSDSYSLDAHKFRLYHDPTSNRFVFFPKNVEEVLRRTDGPAVPECRGVVARAVLTTPEGNALYRQTLARLLATTFEPNKVQARARSLAAAIRPAAVGEDAAAGKAFDDAVARLCEAVSQRASLVSSELKVASAAKSQ
jgi:spore coat protein H